jgi:predicted NUDIX family NTP pyrophosphohydrolase
MARQSAGILVYRFVEDLLEVFLVHPGGPFWKNKDAGAWSIPKGEFAADEDPLEAAKREFREETGQQIGGEFIPLGSIRQKGGKIVQAWAVRAEVDAENIRSNTFAMEWPPRSGKIGEFPEVDRAGWFAIPVAAIKIIEAQREMLDTLQSILAR